MRNLHSMKWESLASPRPEAMWRSSASSKTTSKPIWILGQAGRFKGSWAPSIQHSCPRSPLSFGRPLWIPCGMWTIFTAGTLWAGFAQPFGPIGFLLPPGPQKPFDLGRICSFSILWSLLPPDTFRDKTIPLRSSDHLNFYSALGTTEVFAGNGSMGSIQ